MSVGVEVLIIAAFVVAIASTVQAAVGFGASMLAAPVLALLDPDLVPGPLFIATAVLVLGMARREPHGVDKQVVAWATVGRIPGSIVGAIVLAAVSDRALQLMVGTIILAAVAMSLSALNIAQRRETYFGAGIFSGFGATAASIGGPPVALVLQHRHGATLRATMGTYFAIGTIVTLPAIAAAGRLGWNEVALGASLIPGSLAGFVAAGPLRSRVDAGRVRPLVLGLASLASILLIVRTI